MQDYMRDDDFDVTFEFHERKKFWMNECIILSYYKKVFISLPRGRQIYYGYICYAIPL